MSQKSDSASIVLVDDSQIDVELALKAFKRINFCVPVQIARDGVELLELVDQWNAGIPLPKLILLDIKLPKISGLDVLQVIKNSNKTKQIPVVMLTSSTNDVDIKTAYEYGANSYIVKPLNFGDFITLTTTLCDYWINLNISPEDRP